mgnify:CR=1 FL=1
MALAEELNQKKEYIQNVIELLEQGNTIPFIARYRKELTGHIDDQVLRSLLDRLTYLRNLEKRKQEIEKSITEQGKMTEELAEAILGIKIPDVSNFVTQKEIDKAINAIDFPEPDFPVMPIIIIYLQKYFNTNFSCLQVIRRCVFVAKRKILI